MRLGDSSDYSKNKAFATLVPIINNYDWPVYSEKLVNSMGRYMDIIQNIPGVELQLAYIAVFPLCPFDCSGSTLAD